jgi:hypothetical protein
MDELFYLVWRGQTVLAIYPTKIEAELHQASQKDTRIEERWFSQLTTEMYLTEKR